MAHPEEPTLPEDTGQRKNKNYTRSTTKFNINADYIKNPFPIA